MVDKTGIDLWDEPSDAKCITTNGFVKKNGEGVMGAGVAKQATVRYSGIAATLGTVLRTRGNHVAALAYNYDHIVLAFPVKHHWRKPAELELIERSAHELVAFLDEYFLSLENFKVLLPRPGCGNGQLRWEDVKPVLEPILDDRVWVIDR